MTAVISVAVVAVLVVLYAIGVYNSLITLRNRCKNAFAQVDVQLKRRYDLIPNLVRVAKKYMEHETETFEKVVAARNAAAQANKAVAADPTNPEALRQLNKAEGQLVGAMRNFNIQVEAYPDLKAVETMKDLQEELASTENKVSFARQAFNDAVTAYNTKRELFPGNIFAGIFGFHAAQLFEVENPVEREAVKVEF